MASDNDLIFFGILVGSITMILKMILKSFEKAKKVKLCYGCIDVDRDVNDDIETGLVSSRQNSISNMIPASILPSMTTRPRSRSNR
jgi:hypothetical protein